MDALTTKRGKEGGWVVERLLNQVNQILSSPLNKQINISHLLHIKIGNNDVEASVVFSYS